MAGHHGALLACRNCWNSGPSASNTNCTFCPTETQVLQRMGDVADKQQCGWLNGSDPNRLGCPHYWVDACGSSWKFPCSVKEKLGDWKLQTLCQGVLSGHFLLPYCLHQMMFKIGKVLTHPRVVWRTFCGYPKPQTKREKHTSWETHVPPPERSPELCSQHQLKCMDTAP